MGFRRFFLDRGPLLGMRSRSLPGGPIASGFFPSFTVKTSTVSTSALGYRSHLHKVPDVNAAIKEYKKLYPHVPLDATRLSGGPLYAVREDKALVLSVDGSGTIADPFSIAVFETFAQLFKRWKLHVTSEQIRKPLGKRKDLHIQLILDSDKKVTYMDGQTVCHETVSEQFLKQHGRLPTKEDLNAMHKQFMVEMVQTLRRYAGMVPGMRESLMHCAKELGMEIALNSGFNREEANILIEEAMRQIGCGRVDFTFTITSSEVTEGRPDPAMLLETLLYLIYTRGVLFAPHHMIAVDDTKPGLEAARNAKCWAIALIGNSSDLKINTFKESENLVVVAQRRENLLRERVQQNFANVIAMFPNDLPKAIEIINSHLSQKIKPEDAPLMVVREGKVFKAHKGELVPEPEVSYTLPGVKLR